MDLGNSLSIAYCIPFIGMLLSIALFPIIKPDWWEKNQPIMVIIWSLLFLIPFAIGYGFPVMAEQFLEVVIGDYLTFIVLLFGLFCVAGNISLEGNLSGTPKTNVILLLIGTVLASWVGTTGASMIMIRPLIRANKWRRHKIQMVVFFIFLVSNIGGALTPVGDPPLLMGFMRGVPFFWSFHLLPIVALNVAILLVIFYLMDRKAYKKDIADGLQPAPKKEGEKVHVVGLHNIIFLVCIIIAVILSGVLPNTKALGGGIHIFGEVTLSYAAIIECVIILAAAFLSFKTSKKEVRESNNFTWGPIKEVAILFIGIFITMVPALLILKAKGAELGLTQPWQMFWVTGAMSSFLDNTPTYLVFLTTAGTLGATTGVSTTVGMVHTHLLMAISAGAVFMGANTYIGNAPNFMVKAIAEENDIKMPSFFGYMWWSVRFLIPVFIVDTLIFFLRP